MPIEDVDLHPLRQAAAAGRTRLQTQPAIQVKAIEAWALRSEGKLDEALRAMRAAADHEDATDKSAVTPGPIKPAREMLGEMLAEARRPGEALAEFENAMKKEPGRMRALLGAARSAEAAGDRARARTHYAALVKLWEKADPDHPGARAARQSIARN